MSASTVHPSAALISEPEEDLLLGFTPVQNPIIGEDVIFYSAAYEEDLLLKHFGRSNFCDSYSAAGTSEDSQSLPLDYDDLQNPLLDQLFDTVDRVEKDGMTDQQPATASLASLPASISRACPYARPSLTPVRASSSQKTSKRGRPMKSTSTSKMAQYSRQYREQKKEEADKYMKRISQLEEENDRVAKQNADLVAQFNKLATDYEELYRLVKASHM